MKIWVATCSLAWLAFAPITGAAAISGQDCHTLGDLAATALQTRAMGQSQPEVVELMEQRIKFAELEANFTEALPDIVDAAFDRKLPREPHAFMSAGMAFRRDVTGFCMSGRY